MRCDLWSDLLGFVDLKVVAYQPSRGRGGRLGLQLERPTVSLFLHSRVQVLLGFSMLIERCREFNFADRAPVLVDLRAVGCFRFLLCTVLGGSIDRFRAIAHLLPDLGATCVFHFEDYLK